MGETYHSQWYVSTYSLILTIPDSKTQFTTYFSSSSDWLCCSALARATAPMSVRPLSLRLQWSIIRHEHTWVRSTIYKFHVFVAMAMTTPPSPAGTIHATVLVHQISHNHKKNSLSMHTKRFFVSLVPRPRPAFRRLQYRKAVESLVSFLTWAWRNRKMAKFCRTNRLRFAYFKPTTRSTLGV